MQMQKILVSIDTEAPIGESGIDKLIYGNTADGEFGINFMMDIFDSYGIIALFFVDIAEAWEYGKDKIVKVMEDIERRGHDIGVHIHPDRMADKDRRYLWQYSYEEQFEIIEKCTELYEETLGRKPLSFRAGRYGADNNTIDIVSNLGYKYDMSMYYGMKKRCKIDGDYATINRVKENGRVMEIPVTTFKSFSAFGYSRQDKLDESMPYGEFRLLFNEILDNGYVDIASFFMHSFSFLNWRKKPESPSFDYRSDKRIRRMIDYMKSQNKTIFIKEADLEKVHQGNDADRQLDLSRNVEELPYAVRRAYKIISEKMVRNV